MSFYKRTVTIISAKFNKLLNKYEDPNETLDHAYEKQLELVQNVKRNVAELVTAKKRLEQTKYKLCESIFSVDDQAKEALQQGNENLARVILDRKVKTEEDIDSLTKQIKKLNQDQDKLVQTEKVLEMKVEEFKVRKETMKAQYSAAEASSKIAESMSGLGDEVGDVGSAMRRAEDKTESMNAKSDAIGELVDAGVIDDSLGSGNKIDNEIAKTRRKGKVDSQIENMKLEIGGKKQ